MKRNLNIIAVVIMVGMLFACATQSAYQIYTTAEKQFIALAEQYEIWYQAANPEQQAEWKKNVDPLFKQGDRLLDEWHTLMLIGDDTTQVAGQLDLLKTRILMALAEELKE